MARKSKNPSGGAGLLFLTGLAIEVVVGLVAFRAVLGDAIADSGILADLADGSLLPVAGKQEGSATAPDGIDAALRTSTEICSALAEPSDHGATLTVWVTTRGGRVSTAWAQGVSGALGACIEAEALEWAVPGTMGQVEVIRTIQIPAP